MLRRLALIALVALPAPVIAAPVYFPGNGHSYELVPVQTTWAGARTAASLPTYGGVQGHLATITSAAENNFISTTFASGQAQYFTWIAGYEPNDDGVWRWGAGPENGVQFSNSAVSTPPYNYANWDGIEPNDFAPGEDFLAMNLGATFANIGPGGWGDAPNPNPSDPIKAYIIEYETTLSGVGDTPSGALEIRSASPNPFDASTRIDYFHPSAENVRLDVFDVGGHRVRTLLRGVEGEGNHSIEWDGRNDFGAPLSAGVYFYVIRAGAARANGKVLLIH